MATFGIKSQITVTYNKEHASLTKIREIEWALSTERPKVRELKGEVDAERHTK